MQKVEKKYGYQTPKLRHIMMVMGNQSADYIDSLPLNELRTEAMAVAKLYSESRGLLG